MRNNNSTPMHGRSTQRKTSIPVLILAAGQGPSPMLPTFFSIEKNVWQHWQTSSPESALSEDDCTGCVSIRKVQEATSWQVQDSVLAGSKGRALGGGAGTMPRCPCKHWLETKRRPDTNKFLQFCKKEVRKEGYKMMKFIVDRDTFTNGLQQVSSVTGARNARPVLNNVLIEAQGERVTLTATNLDMGIRCCVPAQVDKPGKTTLPAKKLASIVKELPRNEVELSATDSDQVKLSSGGSFFRMMGISANDFPSLPVTETLLETLLEQDLLQRMLRSVSYAQSHDESRYILNGVHFKLDANSLTLVATDGRRLSMVSSAVEGQGTAQIILPAKAVSELERLLGKGDKVKVAFSQGHVSFGVELNSDAQGKGLTDELYLISKVVDGEYPDYMKVVPRETGHQITVDRELMCECVRRSALVVSPKNNSIKLNIVNNVMEFSASSAEYGESHESMAIQYEGPNVQLAFNPSFILEPLERLQQDELTFGFGSELSPGLFKTSDRFVCVIMPLKTS